MITLVTGGARSGKSRWACGQALALSKTPIYVATSRYWDDEHTARIERHRQDRGPEWTTVEEPLHIGDLDLEERVVVVDCLTLWLTNAFEEAGRELEGALRIAIRELERLAARRATWFLVTNELGQSLHAETHAGRLFVDLQGFVNQRAAGLADRVVLMVAGIPVCIKGQL